MANEYKQTAVAKARDYVLAQKWAGICEDCGGEFPAAAMDFDHVRGEKRASVSQLVRYGYSVASVQEEIDKVRARLRQLPPHPNR